MIVHLKQNWLFYAVLMIILILRFYKVAEFFSFNFDEEYQASMAWEQVKNFHPIWIGVSASNISYYLGPGFTYLNALLFKAAHGDPLILAWFSAFLGIGTAVSIYYTMQDVFSKKAALIAMVLYGASTFIIYFDRRFWNPTPIPFMTVWLIYSLVKGQKNRMWYVLTSALYAIAFHVHLSLMLFVPLMAVVLFTDRRKINIKQWMSMAVEYVIITAPLLVFDIVHNFDNMLGPLRYLTGDGSGVRTSWGSIQSHFMVMINALGKIWFLSLNTFIQDEHCISSHCSIATGQWYLIVLSTVLLAFFFYQTWQKKNRAGMILASGIATFLIVFTFYTGYAAEYFLLGLYVMSCMAFGIVLAKISGKILLPALLLFIVMNALALGTTKQEPFGLPVRKQLITNVMRVVKSKPYALETYGTNPRKYHSYGGWRYLFKIYGHQAPVTSFADEFFGWIYADELTHIQPVYRVVVTDTIPYQSNEQPFATFHEGAYYGYVFYL